jgi:hypothetical protein
MDHPPLTGAAANRSAWPCRQTIMALLEISPVTRAPGVGQTRSDAEWINGPLQVCLLQAQVGYG